MDAKENFLEALKFGTPAYVPLGNEDIQYSFSFEDIVRSDNWTDRWGIGWVTEQKGTVPFPKINPLGNIDRLHTYPFPDPADLTVSDESLKSLAAAKGRGKLIYGGLTYLLFERAWALMGMDNFFMALYDNPDEVHLLLHEIAKYARSAFDIYLEMGVDGISFSEDLGSQRALMISPDQFREFFLPEYKYIFENVLKEDKIINFHSCGCIDPIAKDLAAIGVTMLNPIQARANDLKKLKEDTLGKMALNGGIDSHLIMTGTPAQVYEETARIMGLLKPGGGYICAPDQFFPQMPENNMNALWQAARDYGRY